jgi:uncharacterized protein YdcH (DUF465 family)
MSTFGKAHDPLYDMEVSAERQFFLRVKAAISMILRSKRTAAQIFKMYHISVSDWLRFVEQYPQELEKLKAANAAFFMHQVF